MIVLRTFLRLSAPCLLSGALLAACATPAQRAPSQEPASSGRGWGEMAPIPNPDGETRAPRSPSADPSPSSQPQRETAPARREPAQAPAPAARSSGGGAAQAAKLRTQGLTELNRGNVNNALRLLQQAQSLDPDNALIARDLQRAQRISRAVRGSQ